MWNVDEMMGTGEDWSVQNRTCPSATFCTQNATLTVLVVNIGPLTNCLCHDTANLSPCTQTFSWHVCYSYQIEPKLEQLYKFQVTPRYKCHENPLGISLIVSCVQMDGCSSFDRLSTERQVSLEHKVPRYWLQLSLFHSRYSAVGGVFGLQAAWPAAVHVPQPV